MFNNCNKISITVETLENELLQFAGAYSRTQDVVYENKCNLIKKCLIELKDMQTLLENKDIEINKLLEEKRLSNYKLDCSNCKYDIPREELKFLSDEAALEMFNRCSNCSNYNKSLFESK